MTIEQKRDGNQVTVSVSGKLNTNTSPELEEALAPLIGASGTVILDFSNLDYLSSAGIRVLIGANKKLSASGGELRIVRCQDAIHEIFEVTGLEDVLNIQ